MSNTINIGMAEMAIVTSPHCVQTMGLGSCVGIVLYDLSQQIAGMAHVMLPHAALASRQTTLVGKYANTAVVALVEQLCDQRATLSRLQAKMAGGAEMFQFTSQDHMRIGPRNVEALKKELQKLKIPLVAEDTGGHHGRTIAFQPATGKLFIKTIDQGATVL
ncbi:chemotaxis protein [Fictibacillus macauensis ZFHKF-1]|uniref:Probable chemoreceptor glutamine deamidase CheD n=1 Tax=Fictibacillus macauensis ZFHKF-1 TaxID=1196324 RepID=I8UE77_9BACL|nr:chemotaxis protein CheD [Fictibacillus macauensis]EIT85103.1 chemotaxis protein [Fictibacillus macauensis ZFHKF-1]